MNKSKKGFTLVELLAVIVVLVIITVIAINKISDIMRKNNENAVVTNATTFIRTINQNADASRITGNFSDGLYTVSQLIDMGAKMNGTTPNDGSAIIYNGKVVYACLKYDKFLYKYNGASGEVIKSNDCGDVQFIAGNFDYTGGEQVFTAPLSGRYKVEAWGAQGGGSCYNSNCDTGGYGAYSVGYMNLNQNDKLYINVGGKGGGITYTQSTDQLVFDGSNGYNGGGYATLYPGNSAHAGGGGATSIATSSGLLSSFSSNVSPIVMVAGGGGGAGTHTSSPGYSGTGGHGGGYIGGNGTTNNSTCYHYGTGGTQLFVGSIATCSSSGRSSRDEQVPPAPDFGKGSNYTSNNSGSGYAYSGGGAGLYGAQSGYHAPGGGGSSYIGYYGLTDAKMYCYNCQETNVPTLITKKKECSKSTPNTECEKIGNGYVRFTFVGDADTSNDVLYLYSSGNEFTSVTGGWTATNVQGNGRTEKLNNNLHIYCSTTGQSHSQFSTNNSIDMSEYTKLHVVYYIVAKKVSNDYAKLSIVAGSTDAWPGNVEVGYYHAVSNISSVNSAQVTLRNWDADMKIMQVWLSKD